MVALAIIAIAIIKTRTVNPQLSHSTRAALMNTKTMLKVAPLSRYQVVICFEENGIPPRLGRVCRHACGVYTDTARTNAPIQLCRCTHSAKDGLPVVLRMCYPLRQGRVTRSSRDWVAAPSRTRCVRKGYGRLESVATRCPSYPLHCYLCFGTPFGLWLAPRQAMGDDPVELLNNRVQRLPDTLFHTFCDIP